MNKNEIERRDCIQALIDCYGYKSYLEIGLGKGKIFQSIKCKTKEGVDIKSKRATVEVETAESVSDAPGQLRGHRGPSYIAGTNKAAVEKALEVTKGTTIGVMDNQGKVLKKSTRKK